MKQENNLVSVMMPFSSDFNPVYSTLQSIVNQEGFECKRADDFWEDCVILQDIVTLIARARFIIYDLSGRNANVFYELGIAHTLGKEVILIAQSLDDVPFDIQHLRCIRYLNNKEGLTKLSHDVSSRIRSLLDNKFDPI